MLGAANSFAAIAEEYIGRMEQEGRAQATMNKVLTLPYFNPHSMRDMLTLLGQRMCGLIVEFRHGRRTWVITAC